MQKQEVQNQPQVLPPLIPPQKAKIMKKSYLGKGKLKKMILARLSKSKMIRKQKDITIQQLVEIVDEEALKCPICIQLQVSPVLLSCGHSFCLNCYEQSMIFTNRCSICRKSSSQYHVMSTSINSISEQFGYFQQSRYQNAFQYSSKKVRYNRWIQQRYIDVQTLNENDIIDFKNMNQGWKTGKIIEKIERYGGTLLRVKYLGRQEYNRETVILSSIKRIAPYGFFTYGKYKNVQLQNQPQEQEAQNPYFQMPTIQHNNELLMDVQLIRLSQRPNRIFYRSTNYRYDRQSGEWILPQR